MKTLKTLFAFLALAIIYPCAFAALSYAERLGDFIAEAGSTVILAPAIYNTEVAFRILAIVIPLLFLSTTIVGLSLKQKYYGGLIAGVLQLIAFIWFGVCCLIISTHGYHVAYSSNIIAVFFGMITLPMLGNLIIGIIETKKFQQRVMMGLPREETPAPSVHNAIPALQPVSAAAELKQYKELLDMGGITQEEYEAKKQQLLGFPNTYSVPATPQNLGKCVVCGRENVPLETIEVTVAGMSRKRTMCPECTAKYK